MRNKLFATAKGVISLSWFIAALFLFVAVADNGTLSASTTPQISAGLQTSPLAKGESNPQLDKATFAQKTKKLQIPFIANNGQVDERVKFYAKTFGGTVFVTKDGEIVYALPNNSSDVETQCLASLMYLPNGIQDNHVSDIIHPASWIVDNDKSEFKNLKSTSSDPKNLKLSNPKSAIRNPQFAI